jgi:hypothetical protein
MYLTAINLDERPRVRTMSIIDWDKLDCVASEGYWQQNFESKIPRRENVTIRKRSLTTNTAYGIDTQLHTIVPLSNGGCVRLLLF